MLNIRFILAIALLLTACGDDDTRRDPGTGGVDASVDSSVTGKMDATTMPPKKPGQISGRVWAPGNAPGMVPDGHEIPIASAAVRLTGANPDGVPQQAYCAECIEIDRFTVLSDHQGRFQLKNVVPGDYWLTIQKGQFRYSRPITVGEDENIELTTAEGTLPSVHDPANGKWLPRVAIATGNYDEIESVFGKMGIGGLSPNNRFFGPAPNMDFYRNINNDSDVQTTGSVTGLVTNYDALRQYHIVFFPCASSDNGSLLEREDVRLNLQRYVREGGKLYVTDWSSEWMDNVFPEQVEFSSSHDTPASAYDAVNNTWSVNKFSNGDGGSKYRSDRSKAVDEGLLQWMSGQKGPDSDSPANTVEYSGASFPVVDNYNWIEAVHSVDLGVNAEGERVVDEPKVWVLGGKGSSEPTNPLAVSFEPTGCGRVLYSTYHTTHDPHDGLLPQERILLFLIMEIGVCKEGPIIE